MLCVASAANVDLAIELPSFGGGVAPAAASTATVTVDAGAILTVSARYFVFIIIIIVVILLLGAIDSNIELIFIASPQPRIPTTCVTGHGIQKRDGKVGGGQAEGTRD